MKKAFVAGVTILLLASCAAPNPEQPQTSVKYPKKPADNPERKSGPAMLFYEAAEADADPGNIVVTPPDQKKGNSEE